MKIPCLPAVLALGLFAVLPDMAHAEAISAANADGESDRIAPPASAYVFPPADPTTLRVTRLSATQNKIEWNHDGANVTEFHLYRAKGNEEWDYLWSDATHPEQLQHVVLAAGARTYYDDRADADFPYRYVIKATNDPNDFRKFSEPSNEAAEYSAKVTLLAGVSRTPLPTGHPQPTGTVSLTNLPGKSTATLNGPFSTYTPYGPPGDAAQYSWHGALDSFRKTGETYTANVSVQTGGVLVVPDLVHPIYDIGLLFGDVLIGTTSSLQGNSNEYVAPDLSSATLTSSGQLAVFQGKLEPSPANDLAYDFASNPRWLALPGLGSKQVRFTLAPARLDLTKRFAIGGNIQVTPATTTQADRFLTLQSQSEVPEQRTLVASVNTGPVAQLRVDVRGHRNLGVAVILLTQDYHSPKRRGVIPDAIPPLNPRPEYLSAWPAVGQMRNQLETFLNSVFEPQMNISVTVTEFAVSKDYDCGVTDGFLDFNNLAEKDVVEAIVAEHSGFDRYVFFVHELGRDGKTLRNTAQGVSPNFSSKYCIVHDFTICPLVTAAHELGHTLGLRHIYDNQQVHSGYAPYDSYSQRIMGPGYPSRTRFSQAERNILYQSIFDLQNTPP